MAVLSDTERRRVLAGAMRRRSFPGTLSKPELLDAIIAIDDWIESNAFGFNTSLPQPFRGEASADDKAALFAFVLERRAGGFRVSEDG